MISRATILLIAVMFAVPDGYTQRRSDSINPLPQRTAETDAEALRLMRNEKLDLMLPGAMRDNNVDMWIQVSREGWDPMAQQFGRTSGFLIFTDLGDRIERAMFGRGGAVENIDIRGSLEFGLAVSGYDHPPNVYNELTAFVTERDPKTIAVNFSEWLPVADGISHTQYLKLIEKNLRAKIFPENRVCGKCHYRFYRKKNRPGSGSTSGSAGAGAPESTTKDIQNRTGCNDGKGSWCSGLLFS